MAYTKQVSIPKIARQGIENRWIALGPGQARLVNELSGSEFTVFVRSRCRNAKQYDAIMEGIDRWDLWARWYALLFLQESRRIEGVYETREEALAAAKLQEADSQERQPDQRKAG